MDQGRGHHAEHPEALLLGQGSFLGEAGFHQTSELKCSAELPQHEPHRLHFAILIAAAGGADLEPQDVLQNTSDPERKHGVEMGPTQYGGETVRGR